GKIYVFGGMSRDSSKPTGYDRSLAFVYDMTTKVWDSIPSLPFDDGDLSATTFDGKIFAVDANYGRVLQYDPEINHWIQKKTKPTASKGGMVLCINGSKIYSLGG